MRKQIAAALSVLFLFTAAVRITPQELYNNPAGEAAGDKSAGDEAGTFTESGQVEEGAKRGSCQVETGDKQDQGPVNAEAGELQACLAADSQNTGLSYTDSQNSGRSAADSQKTGVSAADPYSTGASVVDSLGGGAPAADSPGAGAPTADSSAGGASAAGSQGAFASAADSSCGGAPAADFTGMGAPAADSPGGGSSAADSPGAGASATDSQNTDHTQREDAGSSGSDNPSETAADNNGGGHTGEGAGHDDFPEPSSEETGETVKESETEAPELYISIYKVSPKNLSVSSGSRVYDGTDHIEVSYETGVEKKDIRAGRYLSFYEGREPVTLKELFSSEPDDPLISSDREKDYELTDFPKELSDLLHEENEEDPAKPSVKLNCRARLDSPDAGRRIVITDYDLISDYPERVFLDSGKAGEDLTVEVLKKMLTVSISDGMKYYADPAAEEYIRLTGDKAVTVSGFAKNAAGADIIPEDFAAPKVEVNTDILSRFSPIYENGQRKEYYGALRLALDPSGQPIGNPGRNYFFSLDEGYRPGTVTIEQKKAFRGSDYEICPEEGTYLEKADGTFIVRSGAYLSVKPKKGSGYTESAIKENLSGEGVFSFRLKCLDENGRVLADSLEEQISYRTDGSVPKAEFNVSGAKEKNQLYYSSSQALIQVTIPADDLSGIKKARIRRGSLDNAGKAEPVWGEWSDISSGGRITIDREGRYMLEAETVDMVGNRRVESSKAIVIDKSAPELTVRGLEDKSANSEDLKIELTAADPCLMKSSFKAQIKASLGGVIPNQHLKETGSGNAVIEFDDFPHTKEADGYYTLTVQAMDEAGNKAGKSMTFSVNRYGSSYSLDSSLSGELKSFYHHDPFDIIIHERNLDEVREARILLKKENLLTELKTGGSVKVSKKREADGSYHYTYTIPASCFKDDGIYELMLLSRDAAGNSTDSQAQKTPVAFAIDSAKPRCLISGLIPEGRYQTDSLTVLAELRDNIALGRAEFYLDGKLKESYSGSQLKESGGILKLKIMESDNWQRVQIRVTDACGNESWSEEYPVYVSSREDLNKVSAYVSNLPSAMEIVGKEENDERRLRRFHEEKLHSAENLEEGGEAVKEEVEGGADDRETEIDAYRYEKKNEADWQPYDEYAKAGDKAGQSMLFTGSSDLKVRDYDAPAASGSFKSGSQDYTKELKEKTGQRKIAAVFLIFAGAAIIMASAGAHYFLRTRDRRIYRK